MISRGGVRLRVAVAVLALVLGAVAVNNWAYGSSDVFDTALIMIGLAVLLVVVASPVTSLVCFRKGRPQLGWMAAATLPAVAAVFGGGVAWGRNQDLEFPEGLVVGMLLLLLTASIGGGLAIPSLAGALRLAHPDSAWAKRWYGEDKMAMARVNHPERVGIVLPPPPTDAGDWSPRP